MTTPVMKIGYAWKDGSQIKVDANTAGKEFERIDAQYGRVEPAVVVTESKPDAAPLHPHFEWCDATAAEHYREDQARKLMRSIVVLQVRTDTEEELPPVRALVRVQAKTDTMPEDVQQYVQPMAYVPVQRVLEHDALRKQYVQQALRELDEWRQRYINIGELADLFVNIDAVQEKLLGVK